MKKKLLILIVFLLLQPFFRDVGADSPKQSRPDSHAPIGVMEDHAHKACEVMLSYRFMTMDMNGLQDGADPVKNADVLKHFMAVPTQMDMRMHMFGAMYCPHDRITLMAMTSYQQRYMQMERKQMSGAHRAQSHNGHVHPMGFHEMESMGIGDTKLSALIPLWQHHKVTLLLNTGVSVPTGSIAQIGADGHPLPYPMQLGSGSFEAHPGITLFGHYGNWSYGSQLGGAVPLQTNSNRYRHGNTATATAWGARRINNWISLSGRIRFSHTGQITGKHLDLNAEMSPSHRSDFRGGNGLDLLVSSNLIVPTGTLAGQRLAMELLFPLYQHLNGTQLRNRWQLTVGWQYAYGF